MGGPTGIPPASFTATLDGIGPVGDGAHASHEFLFVDKQVERCALLARFPSPRSVTRPSSLVGTEGDLTFRPFSSHEGLRGVRRVPGGRSGARVFRKRSLPPFS